MSSLADQPAYWPPQTRMSVLLEEIVVTIDGGSCLEPDCTSTAAFRAAVSVLRDFIREWPTDCEHRP